MRYLNTLAPQQQTILNLQMDHDRLLHKLAEKEHDIMQVTDGWMGRLRAPAARSLSLTHMRTRASQLRDALSAAEEQRKAITTLREQVKGLRSLGSVRAPRLTSGLSAQRATTSYDVSRWAAPTWPRRIR
jgi:hypothetical protein